MLSTGHSGGLNRPCPAKFCSLAGYGVYRSSVPVVGRRVEGFGVTESWFDAGALRAARLQAGLSQSALAETLGVSGPMRVSMWERGIATPTARMMPSIAEALRVRVDTLVRGDTAPVGLRRMRRLRGLTLVEVSERSGINYSRYREIETGHRRLRADEVKALAVVYSCGELEVRHAAEAAVRESRR